MSKVSNGKKKTKHSRGTWTTEEDAALTKAVEIYGAKNWKKIAESVSGRTDVQCLHRWQKVLNPELVKGPWTEEEDQKVRDLVKIHGPKKWSLIAAQLPGRIGKQCRERWTNHLDPGVKKGNWEPWEDELIVKLQREMGNKWARIAKKLPGRTDNAVKNRFNSTISRRIRQQKGTTKRRTKSEPCLSFSANTPTAPHDTEDDDEEDDASTGSTPEMIVPTPIVTPIPVTVPVITAPVDLSLSTDSISFHGNNLLKESQIVLRKRKLDHRDSSMTKTRKFEDTPIPLIPEPLSNSLYMEELKPVEHNPPVVGGYNFTHNHTERDILSEALEKNTPPPPVKTNHHHLTIAPPFPIFAVPDSPYKPTLTSPVIPTVIVGGPSTTSSYHNNTVETTELPPPSPAEKPVIVKNETHSTLPAINDLPVPISEEPQEIIPLPMLDDSIPSDYQNYGSPYPKGIAITPTKDSEQDFSFADMFDSMTPSKFFPFPSLTPKKTPPSILKKRRQSPSCSPFKQVPFSPGLSPGLFSPSSFFMSPFTSSSVNRHNGETSSTKRVQRRVPLRTPESSSVRRQLNLDDIGTLLPGNDPLQNESIELFSLGLGFATPTKDSSSSSLNTPEKHSHSSSEVPTPITTPPLDGHFSLPSLSESSPVSPPSTTPSPTLSSYKKKFPPPSSYPFTQPASFDDITNSVGVIGFKIGDMKTAYQLKQINQKINNIKEPPSTIDKRPPAITNSFQYSEAYKRASKIINIGQRKTGFPNFSISCKERTSSVGGELNSSGGSGTNNDSPFKDVYMKDQEKKENININGIKT